MYAEAQIRQKLIDSAFSSKEAEEFFKARLNDEKLLEVLLKIAEDAEHYGGDAPMQAAYFASQFPGTLLATHEPKLLALLTTVNGYSGHIALALGKTKSPRGKAVLLSELGDGSRFDAWLFKKGLAEYE
jgi:hypothetical protein